MSKILQYNIIIKKYNMKYDIFIYIIRYINETQNKYDDYKNLCWKAI